MIDTLQLGEIEGLHHGTYHKGMFWWCSRGYTPAGVEAWNGIRALDYLQSRQEVDGERLGVTGRSGGGAYSLVDRRARRADQSGRAGRGHHRSAEPRRRRRGRRALRLHVHGQHLPLGLRHRRGPRRPAAAAALEHRRRPHLPARRRRADPLANARRFTACSARRKTSACKSVGAGTTTRRNCKSRRSAGSTCT